MSRDHPHPIVRAAASGELPDWAQAGPTRRAHMQRVARLMGTWAERLGQTDHDVERWTALGYLHDILRDASSAELRRLATKKYRDWPTSVLHGPAGARRLQRAGVSDPELLQAVAYHTLGHPDFQVMGKALYAADFLEPGRRLRRRWRATLRKRMPDELPEVVREIAAARIRHVLERNGVVRTETVDFWNSMIGDTGA